MIKEHVHTAARKKLKQAKGFICHGLTHKISLVTIIFRINQRFVQKPIKIWLEGARRQNEDFIGLLIKGYKTFSSC